MNVPGLRLRSPYQTSHHICKMGLHCYEIMDGTFRLIEAERAENLQRVVRQRRNLQKRLRHGSIA